jgi:hypothetical protein
MLDRHLQKLIATMLYPIDMCSDEQDGYLYERTDDLTSIHIFT